MKILITTGIFPPDIGGPAQYAKNLSASFEKSGADVKVLFYKFEKRLPSGIRHFYFFIRALFAMRKADLVIALDTMSVGAPTSLAGLVAGKKVIIRIGGDFLWESYVERTGDLVLLKNFYKEKIKALNFKERMIFKLTKITLKNATALVFSTEWQKNIWSGPYSLEKLKIFVIENYYGRKEPSIQPAKKIFLAGTRPLKWKNPERLVEAFSKIKSKGVEVFYDDSTVPFDKFMERMSGAYAVILVSLGDVSPNMILDAIRHDKPFILTLENGLTPRIKDIALLVNPEDADDIADKIAWLSDTKNYEDQKRKIQEFNFTHTWDEIAGEFIEVYKKI